MREDGGGVSYCRWSTNDFQCDLYVYADVSGGWTIHVAGNRPIYKEPLPKRVPYTAANIREYCDRQSVVMKMLETADRAPIGLPHDRKSFNGDRDDTVATLKMLKDAGYQFPFDIIGEIAAEEENEGESL